MKKYDNYKNSGVVWFGEIPEHWKLKKLKYSSSIFNGDSLNETKKTKFESDNLDDLAYISSKDIDLDTSNITYENGLRIPQNQLKYKVAPRESSLICIEGGSAGRKIAFSNQDVCFVNKLACVKAKNNVNSKFIYHTLKGSLFQTQFKLAMSGMIGGVAISSINNFYILVPPKEEQTAIANFLDDKTTKIDQAIAIKQKQIELLKERRQILIHKAVTRGLDEKVKLKDSGVEWIGEIPKHWEVKKLFGLCNFIRGNSTFSKDELLSSGDYVALQYGKTYKVDEINDNYRFYINDEFYKETQIVKYDDTILISTSETIEDLGHSAYYNRNDIGLIGGEQILLNPKKNKLNGHYLYYYSKQFAKELRKYATGIKVFRFNVNNLKTIYISVPPISEQVEIAKFIETATTKIATAISLKEQEIEKLKEYKMSLIDGVVTGKVKVI